MLFSRSLQSSSSSSQPVPLYAYATRRKFLRALTLQFTLLLSALTTVMIYVSNCWVIGKSSLKGEVDQSFEGASIYDIQSSASNHATRRSRNGKISPTRSVHPPTLLHFHLHFHHRSVNNNPCRHSLNSPHRFQSLVYSISLQSSSSLYI